MSEKHKNGWMKHGDFILLDLICMQISFTLAYWVINGFANPYENSYFQLQAGLFFACQLFTIVFFRNYGGILRRGKFDELAAILKYLVTVDIVAVAGLFIFHVSANVSRLQFGFTSLFFVPVSFFVRYLNKKRIYKSMRNEEHMKHYVLITSGRLLDKAMKELCETTSFRDYRISRVVLMDAAMPERMRDYTVPVSLISDDVLKTISHEWVDEVIVVQPDDMAFPTGFVEELMSMGITVNYTMSMLFDDDWPNTDICKIGAYKAIRNGVHFASAGDLMVKRAVDILGGLIGCVLTGIIYLFVAPIIKISDPGPAFFSQERIGANGKPFKMHKFRSMYMDAESKKADLLEKNKMSDDKMFKMDDDPRIIGSEKKKKNGKPGGIGNFIRKTSLDEFPQFFDVLVGHMSLVGWRPCTKNEWEKYGLNHRIRAAMKPGITGMWQVNGRNQITDFDEVVRMDREYIENWSLLLDLKILLKTVWVVLTRKGAV